MQNIDFGKVYRQSNQKQLIKTKKKNRKLSFLGVVILFSFFIGLIIGVYFQKHRIVQEVENNVLAEANNTELTSANINNQIVKEENNNKENQKASIKENSENKKTTVKSNVKINLESIIRKKTIKKKKELINTKQNSYLILVRKYKSIQKATRAGLKLREAGYKVFMSKNRRKMKLWIGPIKGRKKANLVMKHLSKIQTFRNAIMYKK